ncbi:MAG: metal-dependent transcriptional regulator [Chloroflexota bacterium]|nr:metal-dependent transcriptional regulator [Chloroflexota bacterium]
MPKQSLIHDDSDSLGHGRLSPVTENYLLSLYNLWEDVEIPTVTELTDTLKELPLTEGLGTSVPSVSGMIRRMQKQGLVDIGTDKRIRLTQQGLSGGENIARRHRLAECLVVELLGMDLQEAHIEAHQLEHGMSPAFESKLMERLGSPNKSPFGRPIPGTGQPKSPENATTLDQASIKIRYTIERIPEEDPKLLGFLADSQIIPNHGITVVEATPYLGVLMVATDKTQTSIGYTVAQQILVVPTS